jgi:Fe-S oxidoreductase
MSDHPLAGRLKQQTLLLSEFLARHASDYAPVRRATKVLAQMHCHHRAIFGTKDEVALMNAVSGDVTVLDSGCCGMAGPYGFERRSYDVSQALAERALLPAVRAAEPATVIVADGFSCREQIAQNSERRAVHFAELLAGRV